MLLQLTGGQWLVPGLAERTIGQWGEQRWRRREAVALQAQHGHGNVVTVTRSADRMTRYRVGTGQDHQRNGWGSHPVASDGRTAVRPPRTGEVKTRACALVERERERERELVDCS